LIWRLPGKKLAVRSFRWLRSRALGGIVVLGYHRVVHDPQDPFEIAVSPDDFAAHLEVIASTARPLFLREAARAVARGDALPRRAVVLTFDDGYADTVEQVLPMLERREVPATVFVTTGSLGREYWWDELARLVLCPRESGGPLELEIRGERRNWIPRFRADEAADPGARGGLLVSLAAELRSLSAAERDPVMGQLRVWSGMDPDTGPRHRSLTEWEVQRLAASPLIEIGAHTVSHPLLASLPVDEQRREVAQSRADLERITGRAVTSFSYPNGSLSPATVGAVREAGFEIGCCSEPDVMTRRSDPLTLPRLWVGAWSESYFARWLDHWLTD
jgi:peptidoglycan/xylan/chitin deacetylase (PgdA/CDA1 family)